jgi:hypothetical protein
MAEMEVGVSNRVIVRNSFGQFISECEAAGQKTVDAVLEEIVEEARERAPIGYKSDPRTVTLRDGFFIQKLGRTSGVIGNFARHALAIEKGARPHPIVGQPTMKFYWEAERRMWIPGLFGKPDVINHPGNDAQPFMEPAYRAVMRRAMNVAKRYYPGR